MSAKISCLLAVLLLAITLIPACEADLSLARGGAATPLHATCVTLPPGATSCSGPRPDPVEVGAATEVVVFFSEPVEPGTSTGALRVLALPDLLELPGVCRLEGDDDRLVFRPDPPLSPGISYRVELEPSLLPRSAFSRERGVTFDPDGSRFGGVDLPVEVDTFASPPEPPAITEASAVSSSAVRVRWLPAADNATAPPEIVYRVFAVETPDMFDPASPAAVTQPGALEALLTALRPDTEYRIAAVAVDRLGNESLLGNTVLARTPPETIDDVTAPTFPGVETVEPPDPADSEAASELFVAWSDARDDFDPPEALRYNVYVARTSGGQDFSTPCADASPTVCLTSPPGATEVIVRGLDSDTNYFVVVRALDSSGNEDSNTTELSGTTRVGFASDILPILSSTDPATGGGCNRTSCHSGEMPAGGLDLRTYDGLIRGGFRTRFDPQEFPIVVPVEEVSNSMRSLIIRRIDEQNVAFLPPRMPFNEPAPLAPSLIDRLKRWIHQGALDN